MDPDEALRRLRSLHLGDLSASITDGASGLRLGREFLWRAYLDFITHLPECCWPSWTMIIIILVEPRPDDPSPALQPTYLHPFTPPSFLSMIDGKARPSDLAFLRCPNCPSDLRIRIRIPGSVHAARRSIESYDWPVWMVIFTWRRDRRDSDFERDDAYCFLRINRRTFGGEWKLSTFEVESVEVRIIKEADNAPPRASYAIWILSCEFRDRFLDFHCLMDRASRRNGDGDETIGCSSIERIVTLLWPFLAAVLVICRALIESTEIVKEHSHYALDFLPVDRAIAVVKERAPIVVIIVAAEVVDA